MKANLVSIIIPVYNQITYTKGCIKNILENTSEIRTPYEIIVVNNGSNDGTKEYLDELAATGQIKVIHNEENAGYPKANNQAAKIAEGEYLCLLNNDTVVTKEWLQKLLRCIRSDKSLGAVGPYTNHSSGHQRVLTAPGYKGVEDLHIYADKFSDNEKYVDFLVFFCVLIRRDVWDLNGGLDEDFGRGNFEDNLFCYKLLIKNYKMKVCGNAYIHHYGSQTFGHRQDPQKQKEFISLMARNQKLFLNKIGQYRTISLVMICADSEKPEILRKAIESASQWVDDVCIVFNWQGYKKPWRLKKLLEVAPSAKYVYIQWTNFSNMRNQSLSLSKSDFVLWLDADDFMQTPAGMRDLILKNPHIDKFKCRILSYTEHNTVETLMHDRLFRRIKGGQSPTWINRCHEDLSYSFDKLGYIQTITDMTIQHFGYINPKRWYEKNQRNLGLIMQDIKECEGKATEAGRLSMLYYGAINALVILAGGQKKHKQKLDTLVQALNMADKCLELLKPEDPLMAKMYVLRGIICMDANQHLAAKQAFHKAYDEWLQPEAAVNLAEIYLREKNWNKAIEILEKTQEKYNGAYPMSGLSYDPVQIQVLLLEKMGHAYARKSQDSKDNPEAFDSYVRKAEQYYRECINLRPKLEIVNILIQILRNTNRLAEATALARKAVNHWPGYFLGWQHLAETEQLAGMNETAKIFYRQVLRYKPGHKEAIHNLNMLNK